MSNFLLQPQIFCVRSLAFPTLQFPENLAEMANVVSTCNEWPTGPTTASAMSLRKEHNEQARNYRSNTRVKQQEAQLQREMLPQDGEVFLQKNYHLQTNAKCKNPLELSLKRGTMTRKGLGCCSVATSGQSLGSTKHTTEAFSWPEFLS
jgi:hypothetical protein